MYSAPLKRNEKKSPIWKYYMEVENTNKTTCLLCNKIITCNQGSTSNLKKHLQVAHKMFVDENKAKLSTKKYKMVDMIGRPLKEELIELDGEIFEMDRSDAMENYDMIGGDEDQQEESDNISILKQLPGKDLNLNGSEQFVLVAVDQQDLLYDQEDDTAFNTDDGMSFLQGTYQMNPAKSMQYAPLEIQDANEALDDDAETEESRRYSVAWQYFKKVAEDKYACKICGKEMRFSKSSNSTSANLLRHLRYSHYLDLKNNKVPKLKEDNIEMTKETLPKETKKERLHSVRSPVWKYFTRIKKNVSKCNLCNRMINMHYSSSSNMIKHLKQMHPRAASLLQRYKEQELEALDRDNSGLEQNTKNAVIWKAFAPTKWSATCKICHTYMPSNKPGLLWCHLKSRHLAVFNKLKPAKMKPEASKIKKRKLLAEMAIKNEDDAEEVLEETKTLDGRSVVWKFFIKRKGACLCILCKHMLDNKNRSTTNLWKHVRALHPNTIEYIMNPENEDSIQTREQLIDLATELEEVDVTRGKAFLFFNKRGQATEEFFKGGRVLEDSNLSDEEKDDEEEEYDNENESLRSSDSEDESRLIDVDTRRSIIWRFFKVDADSGICVYCSKKIKKETNGRTLSFHRHLRQHHFKIYSRQCQEFANLPLNTQSLQSINKSDKLKIGEHIDELDKIERLKIKNKNKLEDEDTRLRNEYSAYFHNLGSLDFCQLCNATVENLNEPAEHVFWNHRENFIITAMQNIQDDKIDSSWSDELLKPIPHFLLNYFLRVPTFGDRSLTLCRICYESIEPIDEDVDGEGAGMAEEALIFHIIREHLPLFASRDPFNLFHNGDTTNELMQYDETIAGLGNVWQDYCSNQEKNFDLEMSSLRKILKYKEERLSELEADVTNAHRNIAMRQEIRRQEVCRMLSLNHHLLHPNDAEEQDALLKDFLEELNGAAVKIELSTPAIVVQPDEDIKFNCDNPFSQSQLDNISTHYRLNKIEMPKINISQTKK